MKSLCGLLFLTISVHGHVLENFQECKNFFYKNFVPNGLGSNNDVHICQSLNNSYYFATLYDTTRRIPVYSAYMVEKSKGQRDPYWCVEPQLADPSCDKNMQTTKEVLLSKCVNTIENIKERQAVDEDYEVLDRQGYDRGHLNPKGHHQDDAREATFTLTNAVPQKRELNQGAWAKYEEKVRKICKNPSGIYVLVGAIPSANSWGKRDDKGNGVNIPDYLWHAYCCVDNNGKPFQSGAATAKNTEDKVEECSLESLQQFFQKLNKTPTLFDNCNTKAVTAGDCSRVIQ